jgi:hypothetical protein
MLLAFGFTAPFAVGFFIVVQPESILLAVLLGGMGALSSDMLIFKFIKVSFIDEFEQLRREKPVLRFRRLIRNNLGLRVSNYLLYVFAGILIATPLPDEIGVAMLAGLTHINLRVLAVISFILHAVAIWLLLVFSVSV